MRQTGKTKELVENIPPEGAIIVVHNSAMMTYIRNMIVDIRGHEFLQKCHIMTISHPTDTYRLRGSLKKVLFDHACWDAVESRQQQDVMREAYRIAQIVNARVESAADFEAKV